MKDFSIYIDKEQSEKFLYYLLGRGFIFDFQVQPFVKKLKSRELIIKFCGINYLLQ